MESQKSDNGRSYEPLKSEIVLERPAPWGAIDETYSKTSVFCSLFCGCGLYAAIITMVCMIILVHTGANTTGELTDREVTCDNRATYEYFGREMSDDLEDDYCSCRMEKNGTRGRSLGDDENNLNMFEILALHFYVPITACVMVAVLSAIWLEGLRRIGTAIVIGSMIFVGVVMAFVSGFLFYYEVTSAGVVVMLFLAAFTAYSIFRREMIVKAGKTLETAAFGLGKNLPIFAALVPVETAYLCLIFLWMDGWTQSASTYAIDSDGDDCDFEVTGNGNMYFASFILLWIGFYVDHIKVNVVAATMASWAFGQKIEGLGCGGVAFKALGWSFYQSQPTLAVTSIIASIVEKIKSTVSNKCNWVNPCCCCIMLIGCLIVNTIQAFGRFAVVLHAITAKPFVEASYHGYHLLVKGGNLEEAISSDFFVSVSLQLFSYCLSFLMGMCMWAWADDLENLGSLEFSGSWQIWFWVFFIMYIIMNMYPYICVFLCILLGNWDWLCDTTNGKISALLLGMFTSAICHIIFDFFAAIVLDALDTMIMCYAIDKSNGMTVAAVSSREPTVVAMYAIIDEMKDAGNSKDAQSNHPVATPVHATPVVSTVATTTSNPVQAIAGATSVPVATHGM